MKPVGSVYSGMPPTPIGRPPSRQQRTAAQALSPGCTAPAMPLTAYNGAQHPVAFSDSNLLQPKHDFGGSSQSLGAFSAFSEQPGQQVISALFLLTFVFISSSLKRRALFFVDRAVQVRFVTPIGRFPVARVLTRTSYLDVCFSIASSATLASARDRKPVVWSVPERPVV